MDSSQHNDQGLFVTMPQVFEGCGGDTSRGSIGENYLLPKNNRYNCNRSIQPHDSDSGISSDGQILEDLYSELKEKEHVANKLRSLLEFTDKQHEEAIASLTAERDSLQKHLTMLRSENTSLANAKHDYEECAESLFVTETSLGECRQELENLRKKNREQDTIIAELEDMKISLQEQLNQSTAECHRINELYANRQSSLLGENETLKTQCAELTTKIEDQDELLQHLMREKVKAEMELKDAVNRSNFARMDQSIEVSYTEDQMLTALDSLNTDRFSQVMANVSTQIETSCAECEKREIAQVADPPVKRTSFARRVWNTITQTLAVLCFVGAILFLYNVSSYHYDARRCARGGAVPWKWLSVNDLLDLVLRIEYVGEVPR